MDKSKAARIMGSAKSEAKASAARTNGSRGGRPRLRYTLVADNWIGNASRADISGLKLSEIHDLAGVFGIAPDDLRVDTLGIWHGDERIALRD